MKRKVLFHKIRAVCWVIIAPIALIWFPDSVAFVIIVSCYANVVSDWGAAEAANDTEIIDRLDRLERAVKALRK